MSIPVAAAPEVIYAEGEILIMGPGGLTGSFTPEAALETARRLGEAAADAIVSRAQARLASSTQA